MYRKSARTATTKRRFTTAHGPTKGPGPKIGPGGARGGPRALFWALGPPGAPKGGGEASRAFLRGGAFIYVGAGSNGGLATPFVPDWVGVRPKVAI